MCNNNLFHPIVVVIQGSDSGWFSPYISALPDQDLRKIQFLNPDRIHKLQGWNNTNFAVV